MGGKSRFRSGKCSVEFERRSRGSACGKRRVNAKFPAPEEIQGVLKKKDGYFPGKVDRPEKMDKPLEKTRDIRQAEEVASFLKERVGE